MPFKTLNIKLSLEEKQDEVERAKVRRINALIDNGMTKSHIEGMPPWNHQ